MLLAVPAIALSLAIMAMRNSTYSIQTSVYVVYLKEVGLVGTTIGMLFSVAEIASGFGALFAGRALSLGNAHRTMLSGTAISILLIALTPLLGGVLAMLLLFLVMRGWLEGRDPAFGVVRTRARRRPSSAGRCRRSSPNGPAVHVDRGSADNGHYRRPLGRQREFPSHWRIYAAALHLGGTDHPPGREAAVS